MGNEPEKSGWANDQKGDTMDKRVILDPVGSISIRV